MPEEREKKRYELAFDLSVAVWVCNLCGERAGWRVESVRRRRGTWECQETSAPSGWTRISTDDEWCYATLCPKCKPALERFLRGTVKVEKPDEVG